MRRVRQDSLSALVCLLTVGVALWSWGGFLRDPASYRGVLAVAGVVVLLLGIATRAVAPRWVAPVVQLIGGLAVVLTHLDGLPVPVTPGSVARLRALGEAAHATFLQGYPPVPVEDVAIVIVPGGLLALVAADALGVTGRRPALTGIVLLIVLAVPMGAAKGGVSWPVFAFTAVGFLVLLALQEASRVRRWGRTLDPVDGRLGAPNQRGPVVVGVTATALAVVVPLALPVLHLDLKGWGAGGGDGPITVSNPMVGMFTNLRQNADVPLVSVHPTDGSDQAPSYLKIAVLNDFNGSEWSTGDRKIPTDQTATGTLTPPGTSYASLDRKDLTTYRLTATDQFASSWLPVFDFPVKVESSAVWRYDTSTYDFISSAKDVTTAGQSWTETAAPVDPAPGALERSEFGGTPPSQDTALPPRFPARIGTIAERVAGDQPTPFQEAVALQQWFTTTGGFRYSLNRPGGDSSADLLSFLTKNKVGYCQQFATAMAAMARTLDIPARVDVGFLHSHQVGAGDYVFRGRDMHAWPELWFEGVGWVRFDPTPGNGATIPSYTVNVPLASQQATTPETTTPEPQLPHPSRQITTAPAKHRHRAATPAPAPQVVAHHSPVWLWVVLGIAVVLLVATAPWWVRRRRRAARLAGDAEALWAELADTARDLRMPWADAESPRGQGRALSPYVLSVRGRESLDRIVLAVERARYARPGADPTDLRPDAEAVIEDLEGTVSRGALRAAAVLPPTVVGRSRVRPRLATTAAGRAGSSDELR